MEARYEEPTLHGLASFPGPTWPGNEAMQGCASLPIPKVRVPLDSSLEGSGDIGLIPGGVWGQCHLSSDRLIHVYPLSIQ